MPAISQNLKLLSYVYIVQQFTLFMIGDIATMKFTIIITFACALATGRLMGQDNPQDEKIETSELSTSVASADSKNSSTDLRELQIRGGIRNCLKKLAEGQKVNIAYLGGSITEADGWRVLFNEWLAIRYPKSTLAEIRATINGTGAEFGACRLKEHVLNHNPDLIFIEFAVNGIGSGVRGLRTVEGLVRQVIPFPLDKR